MEELKKKINILRDALKTLDDGISYFYECEEAFDANTDHHNQRAFLSARDSIIQRFEYCIDLLWKVLKFFLDNENITISIVSPREIVRVAVAARFLTEEEGSGCMKMVAARNKTSHIYHEIMAEEIAQQVPEFYTLMRTITERMHNKIIKE